MGKSIQKKLDELKALEDKATPGPWHTVDRIWRGDGSTWVIAGSYDPHIGTSICQPMEILEWDEGEEPTYTQQDADMEFIAAARNNLIALVQALEVSLEQTEQERKQKDALWKRAKRAERAFDTLYEGCKLFLGVLAAVDLLKLKPHLEAAYLAMGEAYKQSKYIADDCE